MNPTWSADDRKALYIDPGSPDCDAFESPAARHLVAPLRQASPAPSSRTTQRSSPGRQFSGAPGLFSRYLSQGVQLWVRFPFPLIQGFPWGSIPIDRSKFLWKTHMSILFFPRQGQGVGVSWSRNDQNLNLSKHNQSQFHSQDVMFQDSSSWRPRDRQQTQLDTAVHLQSSIGSMYNLNQSHISIGLILQYVMKQTYLHICTEMDKQYNTQHKSHRNCPAPSPLVGHPSLHVRGTHVESGGRWALVAPESGVPMEFDDFRLLLRGIYLVIPYLAQRQSHMQYIQVGTALQGMAQSFIGNQPTSGLIISPLQSINNHSSIMRISITINNGIPLSIYINI